MSGRAARSALALLLAVAGVTATAGLGSPAAHAEAASPWTEIALGAHAPQGYFNPAVTPFVIPVSMPTDGGYVVEFARAATATEAFGEVVASTTESGEVTIPGLDEEHPIVLSRACTDGGDCLAGPTVTSRPLTRLPVRLAGGVLRAGAEGAIGVGMLPAVATVDSFTAVVTFRTLAGDLLGESRTTAIRDVDGRSAIDVDVPAGLIEAAAYRVRVDAELTGPFWGRLVGSSEAEFTVDNSVSGLRIHSRSRSLIYPVRDGFQDSVQVRLRVGEPILQYAFEVVDARGRTVFADDPIFPGGRLVFYWSGRDDRNRVVRPGVYELRFRATDYLGNEGVVSTEVRVDDEVVGWRTVVHRARSTQLLVDSFVGACSRLRRVPGDGLALESQTSCTRTAQSPVVAIFGLRLPQPVAGIEAVYRSLRITTHGRGLQGRRSPYVVFTAIDRDGERRFRAQFGRAARAYRAPKVEVVGPFVYGDDDPAVFWQLGLSEGSRWQVDRFRVSVQYRTLVSP